MIKPFSSLFQQATDSPDGGGGTSPDLGAAMAAYEANQSIDSPGSNREEAQDQQQEPDQSKAQDKPEGGDEGNQRQSKPAVRSPRRRGTVSAPEETAKQDGEDAPQGLSPEAQASWNALHEDRKWRKANESELKRLQEENQRFRSKYTEDYEKEVEELRQIRAAYDIRNTREFKEAVDQPRSKALSGITKALEFVNHGVEDSQSIDNKALFKVLDIGNEHIRAQALDELLESTGKTVPPAVKQAILDNGDALAKAIEAENEFLDNSESQAKQLQERSQVKAQEAERQNREKFKASASSVTNTLKVQMKDILDLGLKDADGSEFTMEDFDDVSQSTDFQDIAYNEQAGYLMPFLANQIRAQNKQIASLNAELKKIEEASNPNPRVSERKKAEKGVPYGDLSGAMEAYVQNR